jgi:hypothetical protein
LNINASTVSKKVHDLKLEVLGGCFGGRKVNRITFPGQASQR